MNSHDKNLEKTAEKVIDRNVQGKISLNHIPEFKRKLNDCQQDKAANIYQHQLDKSLELKRQLNGIENEFIEKENLILKQEILKLQKQMNT